MNVRVRGIYATALTELLGEAHDVVQASPPISERFDREFPVDVADGRVTTTDDRQGVGVAGESGAVAELRERLQAVARDALAWPNPAPRGAVFRGEVTETLGSGALVELGTVDDRRVEGFLPYDRVDGYVDAGDSYRLQVAGPEPPWSDARPALATDLRVPGGLVELRRGTGGATDETARLAELLAVDPPAGWTPRWSPAADDADLEAMGAALERAADRAETLMAAVPDGDGDDPGRIVAPQAGGWVWFGRECRSALDEVRGRVTATMPGHHRIKAGAGAAGTAVDFVEALCPAGDTDTDGGACGNDDTGGNDNTGGNDDADGDVDSDGDEDSSGKAGWAEGSFPFGAVADCFGPREGEDLAIAHGKPSGRTIVLGRGEVTEVTADGTVTVERAISPGGVYDAIGVERREGDIARTTFVEGRWWYATVYVGGDGTRRGTYVNVCTPVELFPERARYVDLHVDVVKRPNDQVRRVDDDELDAAVAAGEVPEPLAERAREVAASIEHAL
jgi:hypothetical protein